MWRRQRQHPKDVLTQLKRSNFLIALSQSLLAIETHLLHRNVTLPEHTGSCICISFFWECSIQLVSLWIFLWLFKLIHWRQIWRITPTSTCGYKGGRKWVHLQSSNGANSSASGQESVCRAFSYLLAWIFLYFLNFSLLQLPNIACTPLGESNWVTRIVGN